MNAAGRHQPQNVTGTLAALQGFDQMADFGVGGEAAIGDGGVNARQFLHDHPAGTDIQVPDLGIAHLSLGQADLFGGGIEQAVRCLGHQAIPDRCVGQADGVVVRRRTVPQPSRMHRTTGRGWVSLVIVETCPWLCSGRVPCGSTHEDHGKNG